MLISDLHLNPSMPLTTERFQAFCQSEALKAQAIFIMGDLFEFWVGDDAHLQSSYHQYIGQILHQLSSHGVKLYFMAGNRDFMLGEEFASLANWVTIPDPSIVKIAGKNVLLAHGDSLCTDDWGYQLFRSFNRLEWLQKSFLQLPVSWRHKFGSHLRNNSTIKYKKRQTLLLKQENQAADRKGDVTLAACDQMTTQYQCDLLIHGHTHRPGKHTESLNGHSWQRWVLSDWDLDQSIEQSRANMIRINATGIAAIDLT
ncbi:MAG: UDP-2,3-diacylglucosamine diphosphatase [Betaproteobacteria bacterium]